MVWIWPLVAVTVVGFVVFLVTSEMARATSAMVERSFRCPTRAREVTAVFASDFLETRRYRDVLACSCFAPGQPVACAKACLQLDKEAIREQDAVRLPVWIG